MFPWSNHPAGDDFPAKLHPANFSCTCVFLKNRAYNTPKKWMCFYHLILNEFTYLLFIFVGRALEIARGCPHLCPPLLLAVWTSPTWPWRHSAGHSPSRAHRIRRQFASESCHLDLIHPWFFLMFHSYVSLPPQKSTQLGKMIPLDLGHPVFKRSL